MTPNVDVITGDQLDQLLDRFEAELDEETESGDPKTLPERLRAQPMRAHSLKAVNRLHALWMNAGEPAAARAVLDTDGASLLVDATPDARAEIRMRLALYRLQIAYFLREEAAVGSCLGEMHTVADEEPLLRADGYLQSNLLDSIERVLPAHALAAIEVRHALRLKVPERAARRAWDEAERQQHRALAYKRLDVETDARAAAHASFDALQNAAADQSIDVNDWLKIADALIAIAPTRLGDVETAVTRLTADLPLSQRREMEVRIARLAARAIYAEQGVNAALAATQLARHSLSAEGGDDFIEYELPWLLEAGRIEAAGERAFFDIYEREAQMWPGTVRILHERLADSNDHSVWWPLCVMLACGNEATLNRLISLGLANRWNLKTGSPVHAQLFAQFEALKGNEFRETVYDAALALAEQRQPGHPWIGRLSAEHDGQANRIGPETQAARLVDAMERGGMTDSRSFHALFAARTKTLGLARTLELPAPEPTNGRWCYRFAFKFDDTGDDFLEDITPESRAEVIAGLERLKTAVYERGLAYVERFIETGVGHPYDGCAHLYSLLCFGLAICYTEAKRYSEALDLHRRGLEASPFVEHYGWMIDALKGIKDHEAIIETGERLWHFSMEHGFGNSLPNTYICTVVESLWELDRHDEILIWLERLVQWQRQVAHVDEANLPENALCARLLVAAYLAHARSTEASTLWESLKGQIAASQNKRVIANAADTLHCLRRFDEAQALYERLLRMNEQRPADERFDTSFYEERLTSYRQQAAELAQRAHERKPWWRFWQ